MSDTSNRYIPSRESVIERAMEGDLRFYFDGEKDTIHYEFNGGTDGKWYLHTVTPLKKQWHTWEYRDLFLNDWEWDTCEEALNAKIFDGKSLLELLDKVTIL